MNEKQLRRNNASKKKKQAKLKGDKFDQPYPPGVPLPQYPEYMPCNGVRMIQDVVGMKKKDNGKEMSSSDFNKTTLLTYPFGPRLVSVFGPGTITDVCLLLL